MAHREEDVEKFATEDVLEVSVVKAGVEHGRERANAVSDLVEAMLRRQVKVAGV